MYNPEQLLLYIEETRTCVRQFEEKVAVSRTNSISADSISHNSLTVVSEDIYSYSGEQETNEETLLEWDKMDIEVFIDFTISSFIFFVFCSSYC